MIFPSSEIDKHFKTDMVTLTSNHLDIIASYLCSQKIIYLEYHLHASD